MPISHERTSTRAPELPSDLGAVRTLLAADRTMMAWLRTAFAMYTFSFGIYRFLEGLKAEHLLARPNAPQHVGIFLSLMGTLSLTLGTYEYWSTIKLLNKIERFSLFRPVLLVAFLMAMFGAALLVAIARKLF